MRLLFCAANIIFRVKNSILCITCHKYKSHDRAHGDFVFILTVFLQEPLASTHRTNSNCICFGCIPPLKSFTFSHWFRIFNINHFSKYIQIGNCVGPILFTIFFLFIIIMNPICSQIIGFNANRGKNTDLVITFSNILTLVNCLFKRMSVNWCEWFACENRSAQSQHLDEKWLDFRMCHQMCRERVK